jgi:hypothetical protein
MMIRMWLTAMTFDFPDSEFVMKIPNVCHSIVVITVHQLQYWYAVPVLMTLQMYGTLMNCPRSVNVAETVTVFYIRIPRNLKICNGKAMSSMLYSDENSMQYSLCGNPNHVGYCKERKYPCLNQELI